jgi:hypothetical protein
MKLAKGARVAKRLWILASYEVAGRAPNKFMRPGGTPGFRRPVRTDPVLKPTPGTWCRANFQRRPATTGTGRECFTQNNHCGTMFFNFERAGMKKGQRMTNGFSCME